MKRLYFLLFILWLTPHLLPGQTEALQARLKQATGTERVDILIQLSQSTNNIKQAEEYAEDAFELSQQIDYQKGIYKSAFELAPYLLAKGREKKAIQYMEVGIATALSAGQDETARLGLRRLKRIVSLHGSKKQLRKVELELEKVESQIALQQRNTELNRMEKEYKSQADSLMQSENLKKDISERLKLSEQERDLQYDKLKQLELVKKELEYKTLELRADSLEQSLAIQEKEQAIEQYNAQLRQQRLWLIIAISGLLSAALIFFLLLRNYRLKRKQAEEKSQLQEQLLMQEKLASLGQLTAGIAHEIKNPLNFINNFAQVTSEMADELYENIKNNSSSVPADTYEETLETADLIRENTKDIFLNGQRADRIVNTMMLHTRNDKGIKQPTDLNKLLEDGLDMAYSAYKAQDATFAISVNKNLDSDLPPINLAVQGINRVFINIFTNACYALNEKRQEAGDGYQATLDISTQKTGDQVRIKITDNGTGIPEEAQNNIFTPFFTTKPTGSGNVGLGLSISHDIIVQEHKGRLDVESEEGNSLPSSLAYR